MVGLVVMGCCIIIAVNNFKSYDRVVQVKGLCEKEVDANLVIWPLAYKLVGNDLATLYKEINQTNSIIIGFLKSNGLANIDIYTNAPLVIDLQADQYSNIDRKYRYIVTSVVTVSSNKVQQVRDIITKQADLLAKGVAIVNDYNYQIKYGFTGLNDIKPQMIQEATANAREAAIKFAEDSKSKVGKIKTASQGQFSITDKDQNTPYIKNIRVVTSVDYYLK